jgi:LPS-assembly lipoprotein
MSSKLAGLGLTMALLGCGFHPLYAPAGRIPQGLAEIYVDIIPGRTGQLLRESLQERLQGTAEAPQQHYVLTVYYALSQQGIGIEANNASTRNRFVGAATWTLRKPGLTGARITSGHARTVDGNDVIVAQFFYSELNAETVNRRIGEALADQITQSLATYFRAHPDLV